MQNIGSWFVVVAVIIFVTMSILASRLPALRFIAIAGAMQLGLILTSNASGTPMMSVSEYMQNDIKAHSPFILTGVLKPKSIRMGRGMQKRFKVTDNSYDIMCSYNGFSKTEFRQGQLLIMQSFCPDVSKKDNIIVKQYLTKHSMESTEWQKKKALDKKSYGLENGFK